ncbi:nucleotide pyrophosphohydrolase [Clostridium aciditolerans]|uniref:Nucleotide pyrophosphohydrolase n=1 Tax=Clostridium aciditolerans TaxID=339861 RepID=A0A934I250_9CLOT|nr:nucleotide pyrophosphohydrolase [Clostridium aciditolerans]MBI6874913.1 nucleotide pyrophosphohydrolase [Clostridium aciditolerans]
MDDTEMTIDEIRKKIVSFSKERGWDKGESAKDLVMALSIEASELMEIFQWLHSDKADSVKDNANEFQHLKEEIADVFWYLIRICEHFQIDLTKAVEDKTVKNAIKYPID